MQLVDSCFFCPGVIVTAAGVALVFLLAADRHELANMADQQAAALGLATDKACTIPSTPNVADCLDSTKCTKYGPKPGGTGNLPKPCLQSVPAKYCSCKVSLEVTGVATLEARIQLGDVTDLFTDGQAWCDQALANSTLSNIVIYEQGLAKESWSCGNGFTDYLTQNLGSACKESFGAGKATTCTVFADEGPSVWIGAKAKHQEAAADLEAASMEQGGCFVDVGKGVIGFGACLLVCGVAFCMVSEDSSPGPDGYDPLAEHPDEDPTPGTVPDNELCVICLVRQKDTMLVCGGGGLFARGGHNCCCVRCAQEILARSGQCPICRGLVMNVFRMWG